MAKEKPVKKQSAQKIWHIYRFKDRYELYEDSFRKKPLKYTKDFVGSGQDDESISHFKQIEAVMSQPDGLIARGLFSEILNRAANQSICYRGYLLDDKYRPAGNQAIGHWVRQDAKTIKKLLRILEKGGLIERVPLPKFDPKINEPSSPSNSPSPEDEESDAPKRAPRRRPSRSTAAKTGRGGSKNAEKPKLRETPGISGKTRDSLQNGNGKDRLPSASGNGKDQNEGKKSTAAAPLSPEAQEEKQEKQEKGPKPKEKPKSKPKPKKTQPASQADAESKGASASKTASSPTTTPPMSNMPMPNMPTDSDAGGGDEKRYGSQNPPCSVNDVIGQLDRLYDPECQEFAAAIYAGLKVPHPPDSPEGRRELCNYAAAWSKAQTSGIPPSGLMDLWARSVKEAETLGNKRRRVKFTKGPEAVWRSTFNKRLSKRKGPHLAVG